MPVGRFLTLEGPDGAGKTTQAERLAAHLRGLGFEVVVTREPGGTTLGKSIRALLLQGQELDERAELLLLGADRAQHVQEVILPAIRRGAIVICDRFVDSTVAYQGYGLGIDLELVRSVCEVATGGLMPDLTLLFDIPARLGLQRVKGGHGDVQGSPPAQVPPAVGVPMGDRIERRSLDYHERVRQGFLKLAEAQPNRIRVIPVVGRSPDEIHTQVVPLVSELLSLG